MPKLCKNYYAKIRSTRMCERMCLSKGVEAPESFSSKNRSVAEAMHVFCRRSLHMKPADEKRSLWLHWGSVMQLSIYIKAHYVWRTPQLFSANLIRGLTLTPCLCVTEDDRRFVGVITNGEQTVASCVRVPSCFSHVERTSMEKR